MEWLICLTHNAPVWMAPVCDAKVAGMDGRCEVVPWLLIDPNAPTIVLGVDAKDVPSDQDIYDPSFVFGIHMDAGPGKRSQMGERPWFLRDMPNGRYVRTDETGDK